MSRKVYIKPPPPTKTLLVSLIVVGALFLAFAVVFFIGIQAELGEAKPVVALFFLIFAAVSITIIVHAVKSLRLIKEGKFEIAEIGGDATETESDFATKLRDLEALKKERLISEEEYLKKRAEMMREKW